MRAKDVLGRRGEDHAADYVSAAGFTLVERNWRCDDGEVDIVAIDGDDIVFIEVKTRSSTRFGTPFEAVDARKFVRMQRVAFAWCAARRVPLARARFDVVEVLVPPDAEPTITLHRGVC